MAECGGGTAETKRIVNPRVEIDTSPPFESVKEAVDRFGGPGPWIPHHLLRLAAGHHDSDSFDVEKMEEQAMQLERDLIMKEQETLNVLKELEAAKKYVESLKINFMPELSSFMASPDLKFESHINIHNEMVSPGLMFMELNQAKSNLNKTSIDLAVIQESVESLNKKMRKDNKVLLNRRTEMQIPISEGLHRKIEVANGPDVDMELKQVNFEAEQFKKMTEASRYEVMKAMTEIERTKNSIKMAEMRLNAAKKMEEAAKAIEAIAIVQSKAISNGDYSSNEITLSFEEYRILSQKAKLSEEFCKTKFIDTDETLQVPILEKFEEPTKENNSNKFKFRNSHRNTHVLNGNVNESSGVKEKVGRGFKSTASIGDVLSRKLVVQDDVMVGRRVENHSERERVSLSQMLMEKSRLILHPNKTSGDGNVEKQYFVQRKKFGFIQVPIPTKQSKKKAQPTNMR